MKPSGGWYVNLPVWKKVLAVVCLIYFVAVPFLIAWVLWLAGGYEILNYFHGWGPVTSYVVCLCGALGVLVLCMVTFQNRSVGDLIE